MEILFIEALIDVVREITLIVILLEASGDSLLRVSSRTYVEPTFVTLFLKDQDVQDQMFSMEEL